MHWQKLKCREHSREPNPNWLRNSPLCLNIIRKQIEIQMFTQIITKTEESPFWPWVNWACATLPLPITFKAKISQFIKITFKLENNHVDWIWIHLQPKRMFRRTQRKLCAPWVEWKTSDAFSIRDTGLATDSVTQLKSKQRLKLKAWNANY
jgi:hypothetical protein